MKVMLTGAAGQLGQALIATKPVLLGDQTFHLISLTRSELDLGNLDACRNAVDRYLPDWVISAGAYTAVDQAEHEPDLVSTVNVDAPATFAEQLALRGGKILQLSSDFVFNGVQGKPYLPTEAVSPISIYGQTKAASEAAVFEILENRAFVMRTSWVYGPVGNNFLLTMLRLHKEKSQINVVADQVGSPTSTLSLASACWRLIDVATRKTKSSLSPISHWSDAGVASWYDFAELIGSQALDIGLLKKRAKVIPISSSEYPLIAQRPSFSVLDCRQTMQELALEPMHWVDALRQVLLAHANNQI